MSESSWTGKVVLVYLKDAGPATQAGIALFEPRVESAFGEAFVVGRVPGQDKDWASNLVAAVRLSEMAHFLVFDSIAEYEQRVAEAPAFWEGSRGVS